jgi:tetratricopeptide (TPR) repeat protein
MHQALRLITAGSVLMLTVALAMESDIAESAESTAAAPEDGIGTLIARAEAQLGRGETRAAIATLNEAVAADPSSSLAQTRLGGAYLLSQDYGNAIDQFQQAISNDDQNAGAFIGLGMAYLHLKRAGPAKAALTEARRLAPEQQADIDALLNRIEQSASAHHP